ncbi:hypothetical protein HUG17_9116 [Dermatophagoides farinae]|uniref:Uncharacterized protein n=1 Tax=Dermatophagoides farinae TaxID=6954 RepID=A0A9D4NTT7_DERFA|nr:hypothetical protein HUG17_9116 [Dermatophagoides farinae]
MIIKFPNFDKYRNIQISDIFHYGFKYWKNNTLRCEYSVYEYQYRLISKRFEFFRHNIWISFNAWTGILFLLAMILEPFNDIIIGNEHYKRMVDCERLDLLMIFGVIAYSIFELMYFHLFKNFLRYRSSMDDYLVNNIDYDEKQLLPELRLFLRKFFIISDIITDLFHRLLSYFITLTLFIYTIFGFISYLNSLINFLQLIISVPMFSIFCRYTKTRAAYFMMLSFIVFLIEFHKVRLKQLMLKSQKMMKQKSTNSHCHYGHQLFNLKEKMKKIFWNRFHIEYVNLYAETAQLNRTVSLILFYMEIVAKFAIIVSCVFISQQFKMNWFSLSCVVAIMTLFFLMVGINSLIAALPSYDQKCGKLILYNLARSQWHRFRMVNQSTNASLLLWRHWIKSNLFVQTMTENHFGFTCGQLFFITKSKYTEILLLNLPLILLFYKKICLSP